MVVYEWDIESYSPETQNIEDHYHSDKLSEFAKWELENLEKHHTVVDEQGYTYDLVLVRDVTCEDKGVIDRQWAYVVDGKLPVEFCGGNKVPKRFFKEFEKFQR